MATIYSGSRWNGEGTTGWRIRVDYSTNSASIYADVVTSYSSSSIWLRFTTGNNTVSKSANTYYSSNNGKSANLLGTISISPYSSYTVYETCSGSAWGGSVNGESSVTIPKQSSPPAPTVSCSISDITSTSAKITAQITNNPENYWRVHIYNTSGSWQNYATGTNACSYTQTGLAHNTNYNMYYQYTNNSDGEGSGLIARNFTTLGNAPTINSVTPAPARTTCSLANNSITYDTNASFNSIVTQWGTTTDYGSIGTSSNITGLIPDTHYYYKFRVNDNFNKTSSWYTGEFTTLASTTLKIKVNGVWKKATPYIRVNGTWKKAKAYMKINGTWKQGKN